MMLWQHLRIEPGVVCLTGGGGKTTLCHCLAQQLPGSVIVCTTTKIYPSDSLPVLCDADEDAIRAVLAREKAICVGTPAPQGKLSAPGISMDRLRALADFVVVEADGSKGLPIKAHEAHEPVIPPECIRHIALLGAKGFGKPVRQVVHRVERFLQLTGASADDPVTPQMLAALLRQEPDPDALIINQVSTARRIALARELASLLEIPVFAGEVRRGALKRLN